MDYELGVLYLIELKKSAQQYYTFYRAEGWYGMIWQQDHEHIYIKNFGANMDGALYFGADTRIMRDDINAVYKYNIKTLNWEEV